MTEEEKVEEAAGKLRALLDEFGAVHLSTVQDIRSRIAEIADRLDPPKPVPGSVVWWRSEYADEAAWKPGIVDANGEGRIVTANGYVWYNTVEWKYAVMCEPDEVPVQIPPLRLWPKRTDTLEIGIDFRPYSDANKDGFTWIEKEITREEAERKLKGME